MLIQALVLFGEVQTLETDFIKVGLALQYVRKICKSSKRHLKCTLEQQGENMFLIFLIFFNFASSPYLLHAISKNNNN